MPPPSSVPEQAYRFLQTFLGFLVIHHSEALRFLQLTISVICWLEVNHSQAKLIPSFGSCYDTFLSAISGAMLTTLILLVTRLARHTTQKIRSSLFEIYFDGLYALGLLFISFSLSLNYSISLWGIDVNVTAENLNALGQGFQITDIISTMKIYGYILAASYGIHFIISFKYYLENQK